MFEFFWTMAKIDGVMATVAFFVSVFMELIKMIWGADLGKLAENILNTALMLWFGMIFNVVMAVIIQEIL